MLNTVKDYEAYYKDRYRKGPSDKLVESFCKSNGLPWPPEEPINYGFVKILGEAIYGEKG
jgi:hypothetical protein